MTHQAKSRLLLAALFGTIASACDSTPTHEDKARKTGKGDAAAVSTEAYFRFDIPPVAKDTFVFKLDDPAKIAEARVILAGKNGGKNHVSGIVEKSPASYNPGWSYHIDPGSITFFQNMTEVCDASIRMVEDHLAEVGGSFLPENRWCPWGSHLLEEVAPVKSGG